MKKLTPWVITISFLVFVMTWGIMGFKIFDGDYNIAWEAYIGLGALTVFFVFTLIRRFSLAKCPHCGKIRLDTGKYCSHCGKEV